MAKPSKMWFPVWVRRKGCPSELVRNGDSGVRPLALQPLSSSVEMVTRRVHVPVRLARWLWNFFGIVCTETAAAVFWLVLLLQQYQGKMFLHADVKWVIIKRRLKMQRYPDMTQVSCISKGLQVPAESLEFGFFKSTF